MLANLGGMQRVATGLANALERHKAVDLRLLVLRTSWRATHVRTGPFLAGLLWQIPRIVREQRIDVVLFSSLVTAAVMIPLRRKLTKLGAGTAAIAHGLDVTLPTKSYQRLVPRILQAVDVVLPVSTATQHECLVRGAAVERSCVIPNGVDTESFGATTDFAAARSRLLHEFRGSHSGISHDAFLLLSVGRHVKRKGFGWFVGHVMLLLDSNVHYWIVGGGPETGVIESEVTLRGLEDRVRLMGRLPDEKLRTLMQGADLHLMPNIPVPGEIEGFGVVTLEAGACGLPTLAADLEGIRDAVVEGANGYLVPSLDSGAYAGRIAELARDRAELHAMGSRVVRYTKELFDWQVVVEKHVDVLAAIARNRRQ
jgi:phosphatidylinositol alpha-1,6-mannosyltransferase